MTLLQPTPVQLDSFKKMLTLSALAEGGTVAATNKHASAISDLMTQS
jgi:hypothetical protein